MSELEAESRVYVTPFFLDLDFYSEHFERLLIALFVAGLGLLIATSFTGTGADLIVGDAREYFEYARSFAVDGHLPISHIKYPCGVALLGFICYGPAMLLTRGLISAGFLSISSRWASGLAVPLQVAYCLPLMLLSYVGFRANVAMLVRLGFAPRIVKPMVLCWIVVTNIWFYTFKEPGQSEGATYALLSLYYWALVRWFYVAPSERGGPTPAATPMEWMRRAAIVGAFLGIASMVRQQNILHCVALPLLLIAQSDALFGVDRVRASLGVVATTAVVSAVFFVLPWAAWFAADHRLIFFSYGNEHFNFTAPHPLDALFHPGYHGLFAWHPAFLLAAIGLVGFLRGHRELRAVWLVPILMQYYLVSSWYWLSYGASFGQRGFFTVFPLLLAGFVAFGEWADRKGWSRQLVGGMIALAFVNLFVVLLVLTRHINALGLPPRT